ncbi:uncharacterized protein PAC_14811 [Phialocephala subalpina]|uniref:Uncharacterized protein n=1 Tax=Phialocephala subalpina TaxID=576137 RepID=A0A1L7XIQ5_9HELO|nr:uncharacterized protein PAC_14811 [Phialocephala subalpina]
MSQMAEEIFYKCGTKRDQQTEFLSILEKDIVPMMEKPFDIYDESAELGPFRTVVTWPSKDLCAILYDPQGNRTRGVGRKETAESSVKKESKACVYWRVKWAVRPGVNVTVNPSVDTALHSAINPAIDTIAGATLGG